MSIEQGFAIRRNGTCLAGIEIPCGATGFNGMVGCCPNGLACPQAYNIDCCPSGKNCTMTIVQTPRCSNSSWDLFDNGGYFCCEHGLAAYNNLGTNICASPGSSPTGILLELIKAGETAASSSSTASSTFSATSSTPATATSTSETATPSQQSSQDSGPPVGAIAGGVIGGVAGLAILALVAWLLVRRRHNNTNANPYSAVHRGEELGGREMPMVHQLDDTQRAYEAGAGKTTYAHVKELPAHSAPVELPAEHQSPR
jgi:hypothetical protein